MTEPLKIKLKPWQDDFYATDARYPAIVSGWGTGKTMTLIILAIKLAEESPNNLGLICRKEFVDLRDSTIADFEKYTGIKVPTNKDVVFPNGSRIMFRHGKELDILKNTNLGFAFMEQAEEFETSEQFNFLIGRLRRDGVKRHRLGIIANTNGHNWIWRLWKWNEMQDKNYQLSEATTFDCQDILPKDYIESLHALKTSEPKVYNRFVMNSWDEADIENYVLPDKLIRELVNRECPIVDRRRLVVCDGSRGGADRTVIYGFEGTSRIYQKILRTPETDDTMRTAGHIVIAKEQIKAEMIINDAIGVGAGISDVLRQQGQNVHDIVSSSREGLFNPNKVYNLRDEMWWTVREMMLDRAVNVPADEELIAELSATKYYPDSSGRIKIESKDLIKERLGKSPDLADAYVMGLYGMKVLRSMFPTKDKYRILAEEEIVELKSRDSQRDKVMSGANNRYGLY